jgi:hypothetical protein
MKMKWTFAVIAACVVLASCTSVNVRPVAAQEPIRAVLIEINPKVWRSDFVEVLQAGFARHGIETQVIQPGTPVGDAYVVRYTARQAWDMAMYMTDATIWIYKNDREVASAVYHLKGGGGFALTKWQGTATKIDPVIDALLADVSGGSKPDSQVATSPSTTAQATGATAAAAGASPSLDSMCDMPSPVDRAECRGELRFGMSTDEIVAKLGRPDEMSSDGTMLRYGDRYLLLDQRSRLVGVTEIRPPGT